MTGNEIGDAPVQPALLEQIPEDEEIASARIDGAYDTKQCPETIANRGTQTVILPSKARKAMDPTSAGAIAQNDALRGCRHLRRAIWRRWSCYHR
ncbi:MAG: hypothetical protein ABF772_00620 [Acetobacter orientalis]|uniref:hypothetical protein n=1 Tax=Acetobacter orientalis TaxID=146474 RepID=UPI0039E9325F